MAAQSKQKTPRKLAVSLKRSKPKADDGGMVVFPTASGKLATTWIKNVDNIISEGTGNISVDRLKVMQGKLKTALDLVTNRITEEEVKQSEKKSVKRKYEMLNDFCKNWVGKAVCLRMRDHHSPALTLLVCKVEIGTDQIVRIEGVRYNYKDDCGVSTLSNYIVNVSVENITVQDRICFYTIDPGKPYELVIDVGRTTPINAETIIKFVETTAKMVAMCKEKQPDPKKPEVNKCQNKVKLKRKFVRPEPSSSK